MQEIAIIKNAEFMATQQRALAWELYSEGKFDEARDALLAYIAALPGDDIDERLACRNLLCIVERGAGNLFEALRIHTETYQLSQLTENHLLKAKFHNGLGVTYKQIAIRESRTDYFDKALIEYESARIYSEEAGDFNYAGNIENNVALILCAMNRTTEAREHLDRARRYFKGQPLKLAEIDDTAAQVCIKEGNDTEALAYALDAAQAFLRHGETKLLDDSLRALIKAAVDYSGRDKRRSADLATRSALQTQ